MPKSSVCWYAHRTVYIPRKNVLTIDQREASNMDDILQEENLRK